MSESKSISATTKYLETPGLIRQVESHLVFGPLSRHLPTAYVILALAVAGLVITFFTVHQPTGAYLGGIADKLIFLILPFSLLRMSCRQQAIISFLAVKFTFGLCAFIMLTVGAGVSFQRGQADAWPNLFLGMIWLPGLEFIPKVTPHQRYITIARLLLSIPCVIYGVQSGNWHWN